MEFEEKVKSSFEKVKSDMDILHEEFLALKKEIEALRIEIKANFTHKFSSGNDGVPADKPTDTPTFDTPLFPVDGNSSGVSSTSPQTPAHSPTHLQHIIQRLQQLEPRIQQIESESQYLAPQTEQIPSASQYVTPEMVKKILEEDAAKRAQNVQFTLPQIYLKPSENDQTDSLLGLTEVMNSLKSDLKKRFKGLTKQEFYIFSVLYTLEKGQESVTYGDLASKTCLTSSSIRDYIQRIIRKGIPLLKEKLNNKVTILKIPQELRNLATLDNLMRIRNDLQDSSLDNFSKK